jgi:hypothetical protein
MTTLITRSDATTRVFRVPVDGAVPDAPFSALELEIETSGPLARPTRLVARFFPTPFEFQAQLPRLASALGRPDAVFDWGLAAASARPIVEYEASKALLARVPMGLKDLSAMDAFMRTGPALFDFGAYAPVSVSFEHAEA